MQDCKSERELFGLNTVMLSQVRGRLMAAVLLMLITMVMTNVGHTQAPMAEQLPVELIHTVKINEGESFFIYAYVTNNSDKSLYLTVFSHERRYLDFGYRYAYHILPQRPLLEPGESRYLIAGQFYYAGDRLNKNTIALDDLVLQYSEPSQNLLTAPVIPLPALTITVEDTGQSQHPNPALFPIPDRQALEVGDLVHAGDQLLIHDPNTGYDWIQLGATTGLTPEDVLSALATHDYLQGFQMARSTQVTQMLLNHIHAKGIAAQRHDVHFAPPDHLAGPLADFVRLHGPGQPLMNAQRIEGAVADEPRIAAFTDLNFIASLSVSGSDQPPCTGFVCPALGVRNSLIALDDNNNQAQEYGYWLVRGAPEIIRPLRTASLLDEQLVIPALKIDQHYYRAALRLIDPTARLFQQMNLQAIAPDNQAFVFDSNTGLLELPDTVLIEADGSESRADLTFRLIPDTMPVVLELVGMKMI